MPGKTQETDSKQGKHGNDVTKEAVKRDKGQESGSQENSKTLQRVPSKGVAAKRDDPAWLSEAKELHAAHKSIITDRTVDADYELLDEIGTGGYATVWRAESKAD